MRREAPACRPCSSERGAGNNGSAAQNFPRFSSTATTVPEDRASDEDDLLETSEAADLSADLRSVDLLADLRPAELT